MRTSASTISLTHKILITILLALALWLPRGLGLDRFVAIDERTWLNLSGNFYMALRNGDLAHTFQIYHPGVTTMWAASAGFLWQYPSYAADARDDSGRDATMSRGISDFLRDHGHSPMDVLAAARGAMVLVQVTLLVVAFWLAADLIGMLAALTGLLLIAHEPFILGLTRMLHVDGMGAALMFASVVALLHYQQNGRRLRILVLSAVIAGLAWLTRSPALFLGPFAVLFLVIEWIRRRFVARDGDESFVTYCVIPLLIWGGVAALIFVALWPAMWVDPIGSLGAILGAAFKWSATGHTKQLFFDGQPYIGDPGIQFYPATYLWRTTPVILAGLLLGLFYLVRQPLSPSSGAVSPIASRKTYFSAIWLAAYALLFLLFMTLGDKKFPRYLLPVYYPLSLLAGLGWAAAGEWLVHLLTDRAIRTGRQLALRWAPLFIVAIPFILQAGHVLPHFPYYFTYYNPLLGGISSAKQVMPIGLGEGLDQAARYLLEKPDAEELTVATWYRGGSFNYIFPYHTVDIEEFYRADYGIIYVHQWQRRVPDDRLLDYFAGLTPEHTINLRGIDYARIYDLRHTSPASYFTDWGPEGSPAIRLVRTELTQQVIRAGAPFVVRLHLLTLEPIADNLNVVVRLLDESGSEVARSEGWPFGSPTSTWEPGQVYIDGHEFTLSPGQITANREGYFRIEAGFYDPATLEMITPTVAGTETPRAEFLPVGYFRSGALSITPAQPLTPPVQLGDSFLLHGLDLGLETRDANAAPIAATSGADLSLSLYWSAIRATDTDYTVLLHLTSVDGAPLAQWDRQPIDGLIPTSLWQTDDVIVDRYRLTLPADLPRGEYQLITGLYDLATMERLPINQAGVPAGNTAHLATFIIDGS